MTELLPTLLPATWSEPWADTPPLRLKWFTIDGDDAAALLARIDVAAFNSGELPFTKRHAVTNIRAAELAFYPGHLLLDIQVARPRASADRRTAIANLIYGPNGVTWLDGAAPPIHRLNKSALKIANRLVALEYLRFFCAFVRGEEGPFSVVDSVDDIAFSDKAAEAAKGQIISLITPPKPVRRRGQNAGQWFLKAIVNYGDNLFKSSFAVQASGMVDMTDDDLLLKGAPLLRRRYDGIYRHPPS